jgi:hypothetical protein
MRRFGLVVVVAIFVLASLPASAYADPSGGTLFQILMPALGALWAMWMILANRIRNTVKSLYCKVRGIEAQETTE